MRASRNEQRFWRTVLEAHNPGWRLHVPKDSVLEGLSDYDVHVYVVDTSTGWTGAATMKTPEFKRLAAASASMASYQRSLPNDVLGSITHQLKKNPQPNPDSEDAYELLLGAASNLTLTKTYQLAKEKAGLSGHWVYVVYRLQNQQYEARPFYMKGQSPGLLPAEQLQATVLQIVSIDTKPTTTATVNRNIMAGGGAVLCKAFNPSPQSPEAPSPRS